MNFVGFDAVIVTFLFLPHFPLTWFVVLLVFVILVNLEKKKAATMFFCSFLIWYAVSYYFLMIYTPSH